MMRLFDRLEIETQSLCNRRCPTCLRNSHPDRAALAGYFQRRQLPAATVYDLLDQAAALDFHGALVLSVYNEPLLDPRLPAFAHYARRLATFGEIFLCSNGDYLTRELAAALDGALDNIRLALYDDARAERRAELQGWFSRTHVTFTGGAARAGHIPRHFHPAAPALAGLYAGQPCEQETQMRMLIAHDGTFRLCCEDLTGAWQLGSVYERSLGDLWFGEPHASLLARLSQPGGRMGYCLTCPQFNVPYWSAGVVRLTSGDV